MNDSEESEFESDELSDLVCSRVYGLVLIESYFPFQVETHAIASRNVPI